MGIDAILKQKGRTVITTRPQTPVATVIQALTLRRIGAMLVCEGHQRLLGIISERDIVFGLAEHGVDALKMKAVDLMTRSITACTPQDSLSHVMGKMTLHHVRHLPVLDRGCLCGIISIGDVVKHRLHEMKLEVDVLRDAYVAARVK